MIRYALIILMLALTAKQLEAARMLVGSATTRHLLYGGSRSGKSVLIADFIRTRAKQYGGSTHIIFRRTYADAVASVWTQTLLPLLREDENAGLCEIKERPSRAVYTNGSSIELGGLRPSEIDKHLGKEYGTIWVNEASEIGYQIIPVLMSRTNATQMDSAGRMIVPKFIADENPPTKNHWSFKVFVVKQDPETGEPLPDLHLYDHIKMNPVDNKNNLSPQYLQTLDAMTGGARKRFRDGDFGTASGLIYGASFNEDVHLFDDLPPESRTQYSVVDFGFTHPFVHLWAAYDESNERLDFWKERYLPGITVRVHAEEINAFDKGRKYAARIADHDAEDRATLLENGIHTLPADKDVKSGIDLVTDLLDRKKIRFHRSMAATINEFYSYKWKDDSVKDREPIKKDDHAMDAIRYLCKYVFKASKPMTVGKIGWM